MFNTLRKIISKYELFHFGVVAFNGVQLGFCAYLLIITTNDFEFSSKACLLSGGAGAVFAIALRKSVLWYRKRKA